MKEDACIQKKGFGKKKNANLIRKGGVELSKHIFLNRYEKNNKLDKTRRFSKGKSYLKKEDPASKKGCTRTFRKVLLYITKEKF